MLPWVALQDQNQLPNQQLLELYTKLAVHPHFQSVPNSHIVAYVSHIIPLYLYMST